QVNSVDLRKLETIFWVAEKQIELGFALDAVQVYQRLQSDSNLASLNTQITLPSSSGPAGSRESSSIAARCSKGLDKALAALSQVDTNDAIMQCISVSENKNNEMAAIDMKISAPNAKSLGELRLQSQWVDFVDRIVGEKAGKSAQDVSVRAQLMEDRLIELQVDNPGELSIGTAIAWNRWKYLKKNVRPALESLLAAAKSQPLEAIPEGKRPSLSQQKRGMLRVPLWIVARECLTQDEYRVIGNELAELALKGAKMQSQKSYTTAIQSEWSKLMLAHGDRAGAERMFGQLLTVASERPQRRRADASQAAQSYAPISMRQFMLVTSIAREANTLDMHELTRRAIRESLIGGPPIPDPIQTPTRIQSTSFTTASRTVTTAIPTTTSTSSQASNSVELTVAQNVVGIVRSWRESEQPADAVYQLLVELVLPANRPKAILGYLDTTKRTGVEEMPSLSRELVFWAKKTGKLEELEQTVGNRVEDNVQTSAYSKAQTLRVIIAAAKNVP
ncbi:MAG: hypothetical protein ABL921_24530, partial [Pirellula sp.]